MPLLCAACGGGRGRKLATEYIPPAAHQDPIDNWGTYVFQVNQFSFGF